jgi:hypothetical protein
VPHNDSENAAAAGPNCQDTRLRNLSVTYRSNPTIANYVTLRRAHPDETIRVAISGTLEGLEWRFENEDTLERFDIPLDLVGDVLDADHAAISELSLLLMQRLIAREQSAEIHQVSLGKVVSDRLVNYLINMMLDSLDRNDRLCMPRDLIVLIRYQLGGENDWKWERQQEGKDRLRGAALRAAIEIMERGEKPSLRVIAKAVGVNATTIRHWFPPGYLDKCLEDLRKARARNAKHSAERIRNQGLFNSRVAAERGDVEQC